jgi:plastocyanin
MYAKTVTLGTNEHRISMKAGNFYFDPDTIKVTPGTLTISIHNVAGIAHNLTVQNAQGNTMVSRDIPAGATKQVAVKLEQPGTYKIYCNIDSHAKFGMKGQIIVSSN